MNWHGVYFYINPQTRENHFIDFYPDNQWTNLKTSGFIVDFLLAKKLKSEAYTLAPKSLHPWHTPKGTFKELIVRLTRNKIDILQVEFELDNLKWTGLINPLDKQIAFALKTKGKQSHYKIYSYLDKTTTTQAPTFMIGEKIATRPERGHTYREGLVYRYLWHYMRKEWIYFIREEKGKYISKRYFEQDLLII